ncbi:hypothetical protein ABIB48_002901 [Arthrobacter sp. UYCu511]
MTPVNVIDLGIVIGLASHPQTALDGLWNQALVALDGDATRLRAVVLFVDDGSQPVVSPSPFVTLMSLTPGSGGTLHRLTTPLSRRKGVFGVVGRLLRDNLYSRRVAKSVAVQRDAVRLLCAADVVVSADTAADRAVWNLRQHSCAELMHGPFAMMAALRKRGPAAALPESRTNDRSRGKRR